MPIYYRNLPQPPQNPILRGLALVAGLGLFVLLVFLGTMFLAAMLALGVIAWAVMLVRSWWLGRGRTRQRGDPDIVDVEYRVVHRENRRR